MQKNSIPSHLKWACRRGMLELDVLLGNFLNEAYSDLSVEDQIVFEQLLHNNDQDLFVWLTAKDQAPLELAMMIGKIRQHAHTRHST